MLGIGRRAKDPVIGRGNTRLPHQVLGKHLRYLQAPPRPSAGRRCAGPRAEKRRRSPCTAALRVRPRSGRFPPCGQTAPGRAYRLPRSIHSARRRLSPRCPGAEDGRHAFRLLELPAKGVLPPSLADDQDFQPRDSRENARKKGLSYYRKQTGTANSRDRRRATAQPGLLAGRIKPDLVDDLVSSRPGIHGYHRVILPEAEEREMHLGIAAGRDKRTQRGLACGITDQFDGFFAVRIEEPSVRYRLAWCAPCRRSW